MSEFKALTSSEVSLACCSSTDSIWSSEVSLFPPAAVLRLACPSFSMIELTWLSEVSLTDCFMLILSLLLTTSVLIRWLTEWLVVDGAAPNWLTVALLEDALLPIKMSLRFEANDESEASDDTHKEGFTRTFSRDLGYSVSSIKFGSTVDDSNRLSLLVGCVGAEAPLWLINISFGCDWDVPIIIT